VIYLLVDANVLVAEVLRRRGRALLMHAYLTLAITDRAWGEAQHELEKRLMALLRSGRAGTIVVEAVRAEMLEAIPSWLDIIPVGLYGREEETARRRIPRDLDDWPTVAAALVLRVGIWTNDTDFFGCGCETWVTETLLAEIAATSPQ
jgi:predicted nucleic acid-binding protein